MAGVMERKGCAVCLIIFCHMRQTAWGGAEADFRGRNVRGDMLPTFHQEGGVEIYTPPLI